MKSKLSLFALLKGKRLCYVFFGFLYWLLIGSNTAFAQDPAQYGTPYAGVPDARDVNMYQVHVRPYSAAGTLAGVTARLDAIKALGINVIYVMPIYPTGTDSRSSISPYCIKDFKAVGSEYGSLTDLRNLVDGAHSRGMAVMLDWVVNQTSWDHPWITQHPDYYVRSGNVIQPLNPFPDVAALNFGSTAMRTAMIDAMRYWIFAANIDGYRCDYANNAPLDFWTQAINNLRGISSHKLLMFAEGDRLENFNTGFDMNFGDKWYYDAIKPVSNGTSVSQIQTTTNTEYTFATGSQQVVRYTANHDTETSETAIQVFGGHAGVVANFVVSAYMRGVPFLTSGQEVDFNQTIPWPYTSVKINWGANTGAAADFTKVLNFRTSSIAVRRGTMANYSNNDVCAFTKISGTEKVVVMTNLRSGAASYVIPAALAGTYKDAYSGATVTLTSGATQSLAAFQYIVLTNANVAPVAVTGVTVSPSSVSLKAGMTQQLTAAIVPANATNQNVTWTSSNPAIARVSTTGLVTAVAVGSANITVTTQDGNKTAVSAITVTASTSFTVNFYKPAAWGTAIKIYWWAAQPAGALADGTWPGVAMTSTGNNWYSYTFTNVSSTNLIFNDGSSQTADLNRGATGWYMDGAWYNSQPTPQPPVTTYFAIKNRWKGTYLYDAGANVGYGATIANNNYKWEKVVIDANYFWLKNLGTGEYMHIENQTGSVQCTAATISWWSTQWSQDNVDGTWIRLRNRWQTGNIIHVENQTGSAQYAGAQDTWWSAQWQLVSTTAARVVNTTKADIVEATVARVKIFPNPTHGGWFNIDISGVAKGDIMTLTIRDVQGKNIRQRAIANNTKINYTLTPGLYFVQLAGKKNTTTQKLVVQ